MNRKGESSAESAEQIALFDLAATAEETAETAGVDVADTVAGADATAGDSAVAEATAASENEDAAMTPEPVAPTPSLEEAEATNSATPAAAVLPAASGDADGHAIIVTAAGSYTPSGEKLTGPVDSVESSTS